MCINSRRWFGNGEVDFICRSLLINVHIFLLLLYPLWCGGGAHHKFCSTSRDLLPLSPMLCGSQFLFLLSSVIHALFVNLSLLILWMCPSQSAPHDLPLLVFLHSDLLIIPSSSFCHLVSLYIVSIYKHPYMWTQNMTYLKITCRTHYWHLEQNYCAVEYC